MAKHDDYIWNKEREMIVEGYIAQGITPNYHTIRADMEMSADIRCMASKKKALNKMLQEKFTFTIEGTGKGQIYVFENRNEKEVRRVDNRGAVGDFVEDTRALIIYSRSR